MPSTERPEATEIALSGELTLAQAAATYALFADLAERPEVRQVRVDASQLDTIDGAGAVTLRFGASLLEERGKSCEVVALREDHQAIVRLLTTEGAEVEPEREGFVERVGALTLVAAQAVVAFTKMAAETIIAVARGRRRLRAGAALEQGVLIGADAVPMVALLGALVGVVLAFQGQYQLRKFGADIFMAELVSLGMVREFGVLVTAIIVAGRSGAAISAELATMRVNEEVDALEGMGINPLAYLVLPRIAGITLATPLLAAVSTAAGIAGGVAVASFADLPVPAVFARMQAALVTSDFALALVKSLLFAWIIGSVSCFIGLRTSGGAHEVGRSTTRAVVASIVFVIVADSLVTTLWTVNHGG